MSYAFDLFRPEPGLDDYAALQVWQQKQEAACDAGPLLAEAQTEALTQELVAALVAKTPSLCPGQITNGNIARFESISNENTCPPGYLEPTRENDSGIQICIYDRDTASVSVPFWHRQPNSRAVFREIWDHLRILLRVGGFKVYDPQLGRILELERDFEESLRCMSM